MLGGGFATQAPAKKVLKRWDDAEERLLAETVRAWGSKGWERIAQEMKTDRTIKQLQDHWLERQKECIALLQEMGPAPRPVPAKTGEHAKRNLKNQMKSSKNLNQGLTRVASLRYRSHPYARDDRLRQECEAADLRRVRQAVTRYLTHVHWVESLLTPKEEDEESKRGKGELGGLSVVKDGASTLVVDESSVEAQKSLIRQSVALVNKAEAMGVWEPLKAPDGTPQFTEAMAARARPVAPAVPLLPHQVRAVTEPEACAGVRAEVQGGLLETVKWHDV